MECPIKDIQVKIFQSIDFFKISTAVRYELLVSEMKKKLGVTNFISEIERVENYPDFEKLAHIVQHGLQEFIV